MAKLQKAVVGTFQIWTHKETVNLIPRGFIVFPPSVPTHWATVLPQQNCRKSWGFLVLINWIKNACYFFSVRVTGFSNTLITISATVKSDHGSAISDLATYNSLNFFEVLLTCAWCFWYCYTLQTTAFINLHEWNPTESWLNVLNWGIITLDWLCFRRVTCSTFKGPFCFFSWMEFQGAI